MIAAPLELLVFVSAIMTLEPGDVILTGTPPGVGPLSAGQVVTVAVEGVGRLSNPVTAGG
jgi:2-keto-4-pentenoate hydratase/2-oxohepta-3-ene-1,7-dioic acid hydratase in catechol pathway